MTIMSNPVYPDVPIWMRLSDIRISSPDLVNRGRGIKKRRLRCTLVSETERHEFNTVKEAAAWANVGVGTIRRNGNVGWRVGGKYTVILEDKNADGDGN